jgi:hypothetical protein
VHVRSGVRSFDQPPLEKTNVMSWKFSTGRLLLSWCIPETSTPTLLVEPTSAAAIGAEKNKCGDRYNGMCAHDGSFGCKCPRIGDA